MKLLKRLGLGLLSLALLACALTPRAFAEEEKDFSAGLEPWLLDYIEGYNQRNGAFHLGEDNFALGFHDPATGVTYYFGGEDRFRIAGSMYKLPLNMIYTDRIAEGRCGENDYVRGYTVQAAMYNSMVYSDNDAALALANGLARSDFAYDGSRDSWNAMWYSLARYTDLSETELPAEYLNNYQSPHFVIETLKTLYDNAEHYSGVIEHMKLANPGHYLRTDEGAYTVAHKYGAYNGEMNDCAIVYTPRPFLMVVFTRHVAGAENVMGAMRELCTAYALWLEQHGEALQSPSPRQQTLANLRDAMRRVRRQQESE